MEKKLFITPELNIIEIENDEIITGSFDPNGIMSKPESSTYDMYN